jgi:hypothetical protein
MRPQDFRVDGSQINVECDENIWHEDAGLDSDPGKLSLLRQWLYDDSEFDPTPRTAPSIITRSEAELFGVSSPRFAVRAYLTKNSFVNIRRRSVLRNMVKLTFHDEDTLERLSQALSKKDHTWIADSLLEPPPRLSHCEFLTTRLARAYGEESEADVTPFVTHISVGGGLCAQAACFMSLCLTPSRQIFGISEITRLALGDQPVLKIHGLTSESIANFFCHESIMLNAQHQEFSDEGPDEQHFIKTAIKAYIRSKVPLIAIVSLSRMQGAHHLYKHNKAILQLNRYELDDDRSLLPIGLSGHTEAQKSVLRNHPENDRHCVVIVGVSDNSVCLHDPATFPFLEATYSQLIDARAYVPNPDADNEVGAQVVEDDPDDPIAGILVAPFQMVSVTARPVMVSLLDHIGEYADAKEGLLRTAMEIQESEYRDFGIQSITREFGDFFLLQKKSDSERHTLDSQRKELPELDQHLLAELADSWYWVQKRHHPTTSNEFRQTLWFWNACAAADELVESLVMVLIQQTPNDDSSWIKRAQPS